MSEENKIEEGQEAPQKKRYSLKKKTIPIEIENESGDILNYTLVEISGPDREEFIDKMSNRARYDEKGGFAGMKSIKGLHAWLISKSLLNPDGKHVTEKEAGIFPASLQAELFEEAQKLSGLDVKASTKAKND